MGQFFKSDTSIDELFSKLNQFKKSSLKKLNRIAIKNKNNSLFNV